ncbi:MAG: hypothetical protein ACYC06_02595 [Ilumatobacteraceae bacterium]
MITLRELNLALQRLRFTIQDAGLLDRTGGSSQCVTTDAAIQIALSTITGAASDQGHNGEND